MRNGAYNLQLVYHHPESDNALLLGAGLSVLSTGGPTVVRVNNVATFDDLTSEFGSTLYLNARVNVPADRYTIDLYNQQNQHVQTLTGRVVGSQLDASWNLTGGEVPVTGDLQALVMFGNSQNPNQSSPATAKFKSGPAPGSLPDDNFVIAWDLSDYPALDQNRIQSHLISSVVNPLGKPGILGTGDWYDLLPNENRYDCCVFMLDTDSRKSKSLLLNSLRLGDNFFYWGHGSTDSIGTHQGIMACVGSIDHNIAATLGFMPDPKKGRQNPKHFLRLVILDGCAAYTSDFCEKAFGIPFSPAPKGSPWKCADFLRVGRDPRAFVSWDQETQAPAEGSTALVWNQFFIAYTDLFDTWMGGYKISYCMQSYGFDMRTFVWFIEAANNWAISGCTDLRRIDE
jgi:hypothetical protein